VAAGAGCVGLRGGRVCGVGLADICVVVQQPAEANEVQWLAETLAALPQEQRKALAEALSA